MNVVAVDGQVVAGDRRAAGAEEVDAIAGRAGHGEALDRHEPGDRAAGAGCRADREAVGRSDSRPAAASLGADERRRVHDGGARNLRLDDDALGLAHGQRVLALDLDALGVRPRLDDDRAGAGVGEAVHGRLDRGEVAASPRVHDDGAGQGRARRSRRRRLGRRRRRRDRRRFVEADVRRRAHRPDVAVEVARRNPFLQFSDEARERGVDRGRWRRERLQVEVRPPRFPTASAPPSSRRKYSRRSRSSCSRRRWRGRSL